jgi:hypothetical protein
MTMMLNIPFTFVIAFLLFGIAVPDDPPPPLPFNVYGVVEVNGQPVTEDAPIRAWCSDVQYAEFPAELYGGETWYNLTIPGDDPNVPGLQGCQTGETVTFTIREDNVEADQNAVWQSGSTIILDLSASVEYNLFLPVVTR